MGVGKTIQALGIAYIYKQDWPLLIITPASLKFIWRDEILKWLPDFVCSEDIQLFKNGKEEFDFCETKIDYNKLDVGQKSALHNISTLVVHKEISAFDNIFPEDSDVNELVYLVSRGNKNYLVNNEGFSYSRYIVEIINF